MNKSKIEWCDSTWNPVTGCLHGCDYCYARRIANRFDKKMRKCLPEDHVLNEKQIVTNMSTCKTAGDPYPYGFEPTFHHYRLNEPAQKAKPQNIFVCSMADLFGNWVPEEWTDKVFQACLNADRHRYIFLTKSPQRYDSAIDFTCSEDRGCEIDHWDNMWFGTTINNQKDMARVEHLETFSEGHKFLSIEPLLEKIELDLSGIRCPVCGSVNVYQDNPATTPKGIPPYYCDDCGEWEGEEPAKLIEWVIVGAQTGPGAKQPEPEWVQSIIDQCREADIPIFLKNNLNWPMRIQEFPWDIFNIKESD